MFLFEYLRIRRKLLNLICIQDSDGEKCKVLFLYIKFGVRNQIKQKNCLADSIANIGYLYIIINICHKHYYMK